MAGEFLTMGVDIQADGAAWEVCSWPSGAVIAVGFEEFEG
jgi:hypothetical protein